MSSFVSWDFLYSFGMANAFELLGEHGATYADRIADLQVVAARLPRLDDLDWCNRQFVEFGRPDLVISARIELPPLTHIPDPANYGHVGNFGSDFKEYMGVDTVTIAGEVSSRSEEKPVPVTPEHIYRIVKDNGEAWGVGNVSKPAYHRAFCIEPEFMADLTVRASSGQEALATLGPEVFVAHGIMSHLVDANDSSVRLPDGSVNTRYFCATQL